MRSFKCPGCSSIQKLTKNKKCPECGFHQKRIFGFWAFANIKNLRCFWCESLLIPCPKNNHINSKYWKEKKSPDAVLLICPNHCSKDGSYHKQTSDKTKSIFRNRFYNKNK